MALCLPNERDEKEVYLRIETIIGIVKQLSNITLNNHLKK